MPINIRAIILVILVVVIIAGGIVILARYAPGQPVEISLPATPEPAGDIYIGGVVAAPGIYPFHAEDSVGELLQAAGGATGDAGAARLELIVPAGEPGPQRIDINRAEAWLLEALPGLGETKAKAITEYRRQHGPFRNVDELAKVAGIGAATVDSIRNMITVGE